jgi:uncharacterized metal-binding protein (TIGR02443 family)
MIRKQFIAGARCPQCNAEDKVRYCRDGEREWMECVACGRASDRPPAPEHPQPEPETAISVVRLQPGK